MKRYSLKLKNRFAQNVLILLIATIILIYLINTRWHLKYFNSSIEDIPVVKIQFVYKSPTTEPNFFYLTGSPSVFLYENESFSEIEVFPNSRKILAKRKPSFSTKKKVFKTCKKGGKTYSPKTLGESFDEEVLRRHPNLPEFLTTSKQLVKSIPHLTKIRWSGTVYQESWNENPKCFLYSANFDGRLKPGLDSEITKPTKWHCLKLVSSATELRNVRIISLCEEKIVKLNFHCQFWFNEIEDPVVSPVYEAYFPDSFVGTYGPLKLEPIMMSCKVPKRNKNFEVPIAVSIVKKLCTVPTNILKIGGSPFRKEERELMEKKNNFTIGVCGKSIFYFNEDFSIRLIEWIELLKSLGISKFFLYKTACHENVGKVLDYYEKEGIVKLISFHFPSPHVQEGTFLRLWTKTNLAEYRAGQRMFYNDCILRNKDDFDYLAIFDYDEIPILQRHKNLPEMMTFFRKLSDDMASNLSIAAFGLPWKTFYPNLQPGPRAVNISNQLHVLRHNRRSSLNVTLKSERNVKSIYDTRKTLYVASHGPIKHGSASPFSDIMVGLPRTIAYTGHFTEKLCGSDCEKELEEEIELIQYKDYIENRMKIILNKIYSD